MFSNRRIVVPFVLFKKKLLSILLILLIIHYINIIDYC